MYYNKSTKDTDNLGFNFDNSLVAIEIVTLHNTISEFGTIEYGMIEKGNNNQR